MNSLKVSAWLAVAMGAIGSGLKIVRVLRQSEWWPFFVYDYLAVFLLVVGGVAVLRGGVTGRWLAAGWGFGVAMTYGSFFGHLEKLTSHTGVDPSFERTMVASTGLLLAINLAGLVLTLWRASGARAQPAA